MDYASGVFCVVVIILSFFLIAASSIGMLCIDNNPDNYTESNNYAFLISATIFSFISLGCVGGYMYINRKNAKSDMSKSALKDTRGLAENTLAYINGQELNREKARASAAAAEKASAVANELPVVIHTNPAEEPQEHLGAYW
jgi:hypothetical protein